jgi:NADP-dependent 3-hydroxy acid dehydrogenase YdfG
MSNERKFFMEIQGSVVVVTGASSGIGLATARSFAQAGAKVVLAARSSETINAVAEELRELGYEALAITTDVRDQTQVQHLIDKLVGYKGRADLVCSGNAGGDRLSQRSWQAAAFDTLPRCAGAHAALALQGVWAEKG